MRGQQRNEVREMGVWKSYFLWLLKLFTIVLIVFVFIPAFIGALAVKAPEILGKGAATADSSAVKVGVVELEGPIEGSKEVLEQLHEQVADGDLKAVVLRIDSPGGSVGPSQDIYDAVKKLKEKKPIVVSMGSVAASGGLYASLAASKVYAQPGTITGSIGVILQVPNFTKVADWVGVDMITVKSGDLKDVGNPFRAMTEKDRTFLQETVSQSYDAFLTAVVDGRGLEREAVKKFADGRVILGSQALEYGLIDGHGTVYDAAREAALLAEVELKEGEYPELVYAEDELSKIKEFLRISTWVRSTVPTGMRLAYIMQ